MFWWIINSALNRSKKSESIIGEDCDSIIDFKSIFMPDLNCKNRKESILKIPQSILKIDRAIADVGAKSANRGSTNNKGSTG